jgi:hypothetical protein
LRRRLQLINGRKTQVSISRATHSMFVCCESTKLSAYCGG